MANRTLRTLPPSLCGRYAQDHDDGIWATVKALLEQVPGATLPMRMGGLGLRSATRCAATAYWASWADALAMISQRNPGVANLEGELPCPQGGCLAEVLDASTRLDREGFWRRPSWPELRDGKRPPENTTGEPGEWQHGWQYWASSVSDSYLKKTTMLSVRSAASRAHHRSHSGLKAGAALAFAPTAPEYVIPRTCSGYCCWRGFNSRSLWTRRCALVATLLWTLWGATELHAPALADSRCGRLQSSACWFECVVKAEHVCATMRSKGT